MYTNHGYLSMFTCVPVCASVCVCVCEYRQGLYLARADAFNPEPHSSARCPESWRKFTLGTREGSSLGSHVTGKSAEPSPPWITFLQVW